MKLVYGNIGARIEQLQKKRLDRITLKIILVRNHSSANRIYDTSNRAAESGVANQAAG
jgi:hypothetical protein